MFSRNHARHKRRRFEHHTYTKIVDVIRIHSAAAQQDIDELWRRIAFSILINNVDDHLHNHGFLYVGNNHWRLSPAFALNPFPDRAREFRTWISEYNCLAASLAARRSVSPYFRIKKAQANNFIIGIQSIVGTWQTVGADLSMTAAELHQFGEAFENHG